MFKKIFNQLSMSPRQNEDDNTTSEDNEIETGTFQERPWIALIDFEDNVVTAITKAGYNCTSGSLGSVIELPKIELRKHIICNSYHSMPINLHEYDILAVDMRGENKIEYKKSNHEVNSGKTTKSLMFRCNYPQTEFDQRLITIINYKDTVNELIGRKSIIILFASGYEELEYSPVLFEQGDYEYLNNFTSSLYNIIPSIPDHINKPGKEINIVTIDSELHTILSKYKGKFIYDIVFSHPTIRHEDEYIHDPNFYSLIENNSSQIVGYAEKFNESFVFILPQLKDKAQLLLDLLQTIFPDTIPELFPFSTKFMWLNNPSYFLPNEVDLRKEKETINKGYIEKLEEIDKRITHNKENFDYLHKLLTSTDDELVKAVGTYLEYLGYQDVIYYDEVNPGINEEDIQVLLDDGLLVTEVKGIGGTSTDNACSQINKIKHRRQEERNKFDVSALYIVNHQRHIPPIERRNPPFTKQQIQDAKNDKRGLLSTYQLFCLFPLIESGLIKKEAVRNSLLEFGLCDLKPFDWKSIGKPISLHYKNTVVLIDIKDTKLEVGDDLLLNLDGLWRTLNVESIMVNNREVSEASKGKIGLRLSSKVTNGSTIWVKN